MKKRTAPSEAIFEELSRTDAPPNYARIRAAMALDVEMGVMVAHQTGEYDAVYTLARVRREQWTVLTTVVPEVTVSNGGEWAQLLGDVEVVDAPPPGRAEVNKLIEAATGEPWRPPAKPKPAEDKRDLAREMIAEGASTSRIAKQLKMSPRTVEALR